MAEGSLLFSSGFDCTPRHATIPVRIIDTESRVPPIDQAGGYPGADKPAKVLRHSVEVSDRDVYESTGLIEAALQDEAMKMGIES
jgi:hypothetical protein